ncbi:hypothetical protein, partial [Campylobacter troglodytis]|uniref:hypothetical protein n=1 Tax=Campylobacter troglodytis TaxID=654363 RepID=UPI001C8ED33D
QMLAFLENERVIKQWEARSGEALMNLKEDLQENRQEKQKEKKREKIFDILVSYDKLDLKGIEFNQKDELCSLFKAFDIKEESEISLRIKETKRILILIERFKETTEATLARMNIYIDGKRVKQDGSIENEKGIKSIDDETFPYAYILDRPGPDCIKSGINLRIPEGRYEAQWHSYGLRKNT